MQGVQPPILKTHRSYVDVRDVALAHLKAVQVANAANKRFILCSTSYWYPDVAKILSDAYATKGYPKIKLEGEQVGRPLYLNTAQAREHLGMEWRSAADTLVEMVPTLVNQGILSTAETT